MPIINLDAIPLELKIRRQWVVWRYELHDGKQTKVPCTPDEYRANVTDSKTWSTFTDCVRATGRFDGIGIVCSNGLAGIDLDHCIDDHGNLSDLAKSVVREMQTYTEITPSGHGLRCLCFGKLPEGARRKDSMGIEMYDLARYFTVTGNHWANTPTTIEHRDAELARVHARVFGIDHPMQEKADSEPRQPIPLCLDDKQIIEKALRAKNGDAFERLWKGNLTEHRDNHSDADLALCAHLAFWTNGDATQIDRLFRQSGLIRPKWDERHRANGETYGQMTIAKAVASAHEFYLPRYGEQDHKSQADNERGLTSSSVTGSSPSSSLSSQIRSNDQQNAYTEDPITLLAQQVDAIPANTDILHLAQLLHPILLALAKLDKATSMTFLLRKVKKRFGLTRVELTALESDLAQLRKAWARAEAEREAKQAAAEREEDAKPIEISGPDRTEAIEFLKDPNLIARIDEDITNLGYVGEHHNKVNLYLVASSRKQANPLSAVVKSPSSYGKSELVSAVAELMPPEEVHEFTRMTAQALTYMPADALVHKLLIIAERNGSEESDYSIRVMQSEKKLKVAFPIKDPVTGEMRTAEHAVNGPMAYIETTTRPTIHAENATRVFELYLDGSEEQTQKIHEAQRKNALLEGLRKRNQRATIIRRQQNAQRLLRLVNVVIPYAEFINFPADNPRTRRDLPRFLEMIKVVAFLRQYQKEHKADIDPNAGEELEYIEADLTDYELAYRYAAPAIASGLDELPKHSRDLLAKIMAMVHNQIEPDLKGEKPFTRRDIRRLCSVTDKFVKDYIVSLEDKEYLEILSGDTGKGKKYIYKLSDAVLKERDTAATVKKLTTPHELAEMIRLDTKDSA